MFNSLKEKAKTFGNNVKSAFVNKETQLKAMGHAALDGTKAEMYVDTAVKILIAVVIGALLIALLAYLFREKLEPSLSGWMDGMFGEDGVDVSSIPDYTPAGG